MELITRGQKFFVLLLLRYKVCEDADDMIANYPKLDKFVSDVPWIDVDSFNVKDIPSNE